MNAVGLFLAIIVVLVFHLRVTRKWIKIDPRNEEDDWGTGEFIYHGGKSNLHHWDD